MDRNTRFSTFSATVTVFLILCFVLSCAPTKEVRSKKGIHSTKQASSGMGAGEIYTKQGENKTTLDDVKARESTKGSAKKEVIPYVSVLDKDLRSACIEGDVSKVILSIEKGANVNSRDSDGDTPLHLAVMFNNYEVAKVLITYGANVNARNKKGLTPIDIAKEKGYTELYSLLIRKSK